MKGFTVIEVMIVMLIALIVSAITLYPLIEERNTYNNLSDVKKIKSLITYARFLSVKNSSRYGVSITKNSIRVLPVDNKSATIRESSLINDHLFKINGNEVTNPIMVFNQYGVPFMGTEAVDNISICSKEGKECRTIAYIIP